MALGQRDAGRDAKAGVALARGGRRRDRGQWLGALRLRVPLPDEFTGAEFTKIVDAQGGVRLASYACARKAERLVALRASSSAIALTAGQHPPDDCRGA